MLTGMFIVYSYAAAMVAWNNYKISNSIGEAAVEGVLWPLMVWGGKPL